MVDDPSYRQFSIESSYHEIGSCHNNKKTFVTKDAMKELRAHVSFTQLRFHCRKQRGRTIHVNTAANSSGETAVQYFSGQTDVLSLACGSFDRMGNDNSKIAGMCDQWKRKKRGSPTVAQERLNECPFYVGSTYHWLLTPGNLRRECGDFKNPGAEFS